MIVLEKYISKRKLPQNFNRYDILLFEHELEKTIENTEILIRKHIQLTYDLLILQNGFIINDEIFNSMLLTNYYTIKSRVNFFIGNLRKKKIFFHEAIGVLDHWSENYFHWFTDVIPRVFVANEYFKADLTLVLPIHYRDNDFISNSLNLFENLKLFYFRKFQICNISILNFITHTAPTGNYRDNLIKNVSAFFKNKFMGSVTDKTNKKIYISREKSAARKIINETQVIQILKKYNIEIYYFEELKWEDQVKICIQTKVLIALHGASLTNMLFMPENSCVLEFRKKGDNQNNCYFSLASALNINYYYQLCDVDFPELETQQNNFIVDCEEFEKNICIMLKDN
jgi:hypothetical protein